MGAWSGVGLTIVCFSLSVSLGQALHLQAMFVVPEIAWTPNCDCQPELGHVSVEPLKELG
jgi:hypothetical protein